MATPSRPQAEILMLGAADRRTPQLAKGVYRSIKVLRDQVDDDRLVYLLSQGKWDEAIDELVDTITLAKADPPPPSFLERVYLALLRDGGRVAQQGARGAGIDATFNMRLEEWERYARARSAALVRGISAETRRNLRNLIASVVRGTDGTAAGLARTLRSLVGLTPAQAQAVIRFEAAATEAALANQPVGWMRDRWSASPEWSGKPTAVESATSRYADRLLASRAETIARTEVMSTLHQGQLDLWNQMIEEGWFERTQVERHWLVSHDDRLCELCAPMANAVIPFSDQWTATVKGFEGQTVELGDPVIVDTPPLHPRCRCTEVLVFRTDVIEPTASNLQILSR